MHIQCKWCIYAYTFRDKCCAYIILWLNFYLKLLCITVAIVPCHSMYKSVCLCMFVQFCLIKYPSWIIYETMNEAILQCLQEWHSDLDIIGSSMTQRWPIQYTLQWCQMTAQHLPYPGTVCNPSYKLSKLRSCFYMRQCISLAICTYLH